MRREPAGVANGPLDRDKDAPRWTERLLARSPFSLCFARRPGGSACCMLHWPCGHFGKNPPPLLITHKLG